MFISQGARVFIQAAYFVIIARVLGVEQYGAFLSALAFIGILAPFASFGTGNILIKNVSRNRFSFNDYWGIALFMTCVSSLVLTFLVLLVARFILPETISLLVILFIALAELLFARVLDIACQAFQAVQLLSKTAQLNVLLSVHRLMAALLLANFFHNPDVTLWAVLYLTSTIIPACIGVVLVNHILGYPRLRLRRIMPELTEGFHFAVGLSAQNIYNDIDKTMLARLSSVESVGIYGAAYRLIDVTFTPVRSLLYAAYARFFQQGETGINLTFTKRLSLLSGIYGIAAGIALFVCAPVVPRILGTEYENAVEALRWLSPLILFRAMHYFAADTLAGAGFQGIRSAIQVGVAIFNILINFWLLPLYSWRGAAWASLASDFILMSSLWILLLFLYHQQEQRIHKA